MANKKVHRKIKHLRLKKKHLLIFPVTTILLVAIGVFALFVYSNFRNLVYPVLHIDQASPKEVISQQNLKRDPAILPQVIEYGSRYQLKAALTFDADMTPGMQKMLKLGIVKSWYNSSIKQTLDKENVKATIFLTGLWAETYPKEAKELAEDPLFEIGNHSYSHPAFTKNCFKLTFIDDIKDKSEVLSAQDAIKKATGITPKYFRFPGGCFDAQDLKNIHDLGLLVIHWDIAAGDGFNKNPEDIVQRVKSRVQNGSIIVFHLQGEPFAPKTNEALVKIIPYLKKRGYQLVTISELLNQNPP